MAGTIAAGNPNTAAVGVEILSDGGNAVDAAVASALATFVAEPLLSSAGGGALFLAAAPGGPVQMFDCFPITPGLEGRPEHLDFEGVEIDFGVTTQVFHVGRGAATVPLILPGLAMAAQQLGRLPLSRLVEPAVRMARAGVAPGPHGAAVFQLLWPILSRDPYTVRVLGGGSVPAADRPVANDDLAELLWAFGASGEVPQDFWEGLLQDFGPAHGGQICRADLGALPQRVAPLCLDHGGWTLFTSPRLGGRMIRDMLNQLHRAGGESEAQRALALARAARSVDQARRMNVPGSTTHVSVVDDAGGVAAITLTNGEGSGHLVRGTGVHVNNFLGEEDLNPGGFHRHPPGDRLPTMMAPTIGRGPDGQLVALGSGGANRIRSAVTGVIRELVRGATLREAIAAPRIHAEGETVWFETTGWASPATEVCLRTAFREAVVFEAPAFFFGGVHGVLRDSSGHVVAVGDTRRGGVGRSVGN